MYTEVTEECFILVKSDSFARQPHHSQNGVQQRILPSWGEQIHIGVRLLTND